MINILMFCVLATIIILAGKKLSYFGDAIGDIKGLEKSWVGVVMLAAVTSLPELITSGTSAVFGQAEMGLSNIFGSNFFNIFIVAILDIFIIKDVSFSSKVSKKNILTGILSMMLTVVFILGYYINIPNIMFINIISLIVLILYFWSMYTIYIYEHKYKDDKIEEVENVEKEKEEHKLTYKKAIIGFFGSAFIVVAVGIGLVVVAEKISEMSIGGAPIGASFVGVILLALATSLPELTVSIEAVRLGSVDMAAGNILGSNLFNLAIIFVIDLLYKKGNIFEAFGEFQIVTALLSVLILMIFITGIVLDKKKRKIDGYFILIIYILGMYILYNMR